MEYAAKEAAKQGLTVNIKTFSDYVTPDQALAAGDIDLNSFQHGPFLQAFNEKNGTHLVSIGNTYLAPLRVYSNKITSIKDVPDGAKVSVQWRTRSAPSGPQRSPEAETGHRSDKGNDQ